MKLFLSYVVATGACYLAFGPSASSYSPSQWGMQGRRSPLVMNQDGKDASAFSLANIFGGNDGTSATALRGNKNLEPHPSVRPHISPLNRLGPDKLKKTGKDPLPVHPEVRSGTLPNGLPYNCCLLPI